MGTVTALHGDQAAPIPPVRTALDAFAEHLRTTRQASGHDTSAHTIRNYRMTLDKLSISELPVGELDPDTLAARFREHWGQASVTTWNARRAAVRGFGEFARARGWTEEDLAAGLDRQSEPHSASRSRFLLYSPLTRSSG